MNQVIVSCYCTSDINFKNGSITFFLLEHSVKAKKLHSCTFIELSKASICDSSSVALWSHGSSVSTAYLPCIWYNNVTTSVIITTINSSMLVWPVKIFYNHPLTCSPGEQEQTQQQYHHFRYGQFFCLNNERITTT